MLGLFWYVLDDDSNSLSPYFCQGHRGCVNAVAWNSEGSLLISGSDDTQVWICGFFIYCPWCMLLQIHCWRLLFNCYSWCEFEQSSSLFYSILNEDKLKHFGLKMWWITQSRDICLKFEAGCLRSYMKDHNFFISSFTFLVSFLFPFSIVYKEKYEALNSGDALFYIRTWCGYA